MTREFRQLLLTLVLLLVLLAVEVGVAFLPLTGSGRMLVLVPAALMVAAVGAIFMEVRRGPAVVRLFAGAALLWLLVLLGLGSIDPVTRTDYQVETVSGIPKVSY